MRRIAASLAAVLTLATVAAGLAVAGEPQAESTQAAVQIGGIPLTVLVGHLQSDDENRRLAALLLLDGAGPEAATAVPALAGLLDADDATVRGLAVSVLSGMGDAAASVTPRLRLLADNDPDPTVREHARLALTELADATGPTTPVIELTPTVPATTLPAADPGITAYLQPLRDHKAKLQAINQRLTALAPQMPQDNAQARTWAQDLKKVGQDLATELGAFKTTFHQFVNSRTRRGLTEELDLSKECLELAGQAGGALQTRTQFDLQAYHAQQDLQQHAAASRLELVSVLAREIDYRLEAEGLVELLLVDGLAAVRDEAIARLRGQAEAELDRITERELGIAFHDGVSFRSAVRAKAREMVRGRVAKLIIGITSNEIVIELLGRPIIRWLETDLWPKLKELFRNKDNLDFRTERSIASLERARMRLWSLPPDATLDQVHAARRNATGAMQATRYLVGDLTRANRTDLYEDLKAAAEDLARAIDINAQRFLLHKIEALERIAPNEEIARALLALIEAMVRDIEIPAEIAQADDGGEADDDTPTPEVERIEFGPLYLVHIILTHTTGGPVEKDTWILHSKTPDENGTLLTADGYGGNFINKADRYMGPYTSNYELAPVLVGLGIRGMWIGRLYIDADPEIWGGG